MISCQLNLSFLQQIVKDFVGLGDVKVEFISFFLCGLILGPWNILIIFPYPMDSSYFILFNFFITVIN